MSEEKHVRPKSPSEKTPEPFRARDVGAKPLRPLGEPSKGRLLERLTKAARWLN